MSRKACNSKILRVFLPLALLLIIGIALANTSATAAQGEVIAASSYLASSSDAGGEVISAPFACPALGGYASSLEQANYCVYFNDPPTSSADAALVEGYVQDYWDRYTTDFGFLAPLFTPPVLEVRIESSSSCNGSAWANYITLNDGCFDPANPEVMQYVTGHELFHRVQFSHDPDWASTWTNSGWIYEGTARNMEDATFANVDTWANCMAAPFSYCKEVNNYLASISQNITSFPMRYKSNLFWTFFREQYGTVATEPQLGVDAILKVWEKMASAESIAAVNNALAELSPGTTFNDAFRQFTVAVWAKDLTGVPDDSYNFADEDQPGNPAPYGPLVPTDGGTIDSGTSAAWTGLSINPYSARYYEATPDASDCQVITADFHRTGGSSTFYHVITQDGTAFKAHVEGSGDDWTQSFLNDGITKVVAIVGGQSSSSTVDVRLFCASPVIDIEIPNSLAPEHVGPYTSPRNMVVQVAVTDGAGGPVVTGLSNSDFKVEVGGVMGLVLGGGFIQEEYFLLVDTPMQPDNGPYDLEVFLEEPGTTTVIATDLEADAVIYSSSSLDHVIITDVSGSMGWDDKLDAAQNAANLFIDAMNSSNGLGLVSYNHDLDDSLAIDFAGIAHRTTAHADVAGYTASGATSIGDGLAEAVDLRTASTTGTPRCRFTLLSDGMENSSQYWADVQADVIATGCPVNTIAFGPSSNELLMQNIATATGGIAYYNDVYVNPGPLVNAVQASPDEMELDLGDSYLYSLCGGRDCERLYSEDGVSITPGELITHTMFVDDEVLDLTVILDWLPSSPRFQDFALTLYSPSDEVFATPTFTSTVSGYVGYHFEGAPEVGEWQLVVYRRAQATVTPQPYRLIAYGQTPVSVNLLLPNMESFATGHYVPLFAIWHPGGTVLATVKAPDGSLRNIQLMDDGEHGDGAAGDGFFAGMYTLVTQSLVQQPVDEGVENPPDAADEAAYRVRLLAEFEGMRRESQGSFAVPAGADEAPADGIPDDYINTHCPGAPNSDADLDHADCADEYYLGTDPNNSDTDGGGESDYSEAVLNASLPLDALMAGDDMIEAPDFVHTTAQNGSVLLNYDVKVAYNSMIGYRATNPDGPWSLFSSELPLMGVYTDTDVTNDTSYYYCLQAIDSDTTPQHESAVVCSDVVTPRLDPIPPEAIMLINGGAMTTTNPIVELTFIPVEEGPDAGLFAAQQENFDDIVEVILSNEPTFSEASWQPFTTTMAWELLPGVGMRTVYARFKDESGNESVGVETASIYLAEVVVDEKTIYLPLVIKGAGQ